MKKSCKTGKETVENYFKMNFNKLQVDAVSNLGLAHIGDGVFELLTRSYLCRKGETTVRTLHRDAVALVNAPAQARFGEKLLPYLDEEEQGYFRRGKNAHTHAAPKAASRLEYAMATGVETLFGALYLYGRTERLNELFNKVMEELYGL
ncbi:MAG: Mini-ribonuclease 3 [Faecousia sp.]